MTEFDRRLVARAFGSALREVRTNAGMSQETLALCTGRDRTYPSLLERGLRMPSIGVLIEFARTLDVDPALLINMTMKILRENEAVMIN